MQIVLGKWKSDVGVLQYEGRKKKTKKCGSRKKII
jgi:hypothetical protein